MEKKEFLQSFRKLEYYCYSEGWYGWDPYDGLNSRIFKNLPIVKSNTAARLAWIQFFKQSPVNLRKFFLVPKGYNSKGLGLFLTGYCHIYNLQKITGEILLEDQDIIKNKILRLADLLIYIQSRGYSGSCWGYNFDWQSKAFFLPENTPTVVATSFVVESLLKAYEVTGIQNYLDTAVSSARFITNDLKQIRKRRGFMFSYSPLDNRAVYNASLLGTKTLALIYKYTGDNSIREIAYETAMAVCDTQNEDGSFPHSDQVGNNWRDNFHTAFKLESLAYFKKYCADSSFDNNIERGYLFWLNNFFNRETGVALYYENNHKLIDLHCAAQSIPVLFNLARFDEEYPLASKIMEWTINNMQDDSGYFYFQKRNFKINKIAYMRWPNAWMFYGMSYFMTGTYHYENN